MNVTIFQPSLDNTSFLQQKLLTVKICFYHEFAVKMSIKGLKKSYTSDNIYWDFRKKPTINHDLEYTFNNFDFSVFLTNLDLTNVLRKELFSITKQSPFLNAHIYQT